MHVEGHIESGSGYSSGGGSGVTTPRRTNRTPIGSTGTDMGSGMMGDPTMGSGVMMGMMASDGSTMTTMGVRSPDVNMDLPLASALPINVSENTPNLEKIQNFPVVGRTPNGMHFHQDPITGQMYMMSQELHQKVTVGMESSTQMTYSIPSSVNDSTVNEFLNFSSNIYSDNFIFDSTIRNLETRAYQPFTQTVTEIEQNSFKPTRNQDYSADNYSERYMVNSVLNGMNQGNLLNVNINLDMLGNQNLDMMGNQSLISLTDSNNVLYGSQSEKKSPMTRIVGILSEPSVIPYTIVEPKLPIITRISNPITQTSTDTYTQIEPEKPTITRIARLVSEYPVISYTDTPPRSIRMTRIL